MYSRRCTHRLKEKKALHGVVFQFSSTPPFYCSLVDIGLQTKKENNQNLAVASEKNVELE
jgi:hypothetical protein